MKNEEETVRSTFKKKDKAKKKSQVGIGVDGEHYTAPPASGMEEAGSTSEQNF